MFLPYYLSMIGQIGEGGGSIADVVSVVTQFFSQFTALAAVIAGSFLFLIPVAIKFTGKTIGFVKSLMGTGGRRRR